MSTRRERIHRYTRRSRCVPPSSPPRRSLNVPDKPPLLASQLVYNRQVFNSTSDFLDAFDSGKLNISSYPAIDPNWAARYRKGTSRDLGHVEGPRVVSFSGLRFRVDQEQQFVSWMGWEFYLGFDRDMVSVEGKGERFWWASTEFRPTFRACRFGTSSF